jgi:hypothetical protein
MGLRTERSRGATGWRLLEELRADELGRRVSLHATRSQGWDTPTRP